MNRRGFLSGLGALVGGVLLDKAVPLGRVWSFPKEIKCLNTATICATIEQYADFVSMSSLATVYYNKAALRMLEERFCFMEMMEPRALPQSTGKKIQMYRFTAA